MYLECKHLYKKYGKKYIVKNVNLKLKKGTIVNLIGPNGSGKTTIFYMLIGISKPDKGKIFLCKREITKSPLYERSKQGIGFLFQDTSIFKYLTVEKNIMSVLEINTKYSKYKNEITNKIIKNFGLQKIKKKMGYNLSGGERRITEIARCLSINPNFIILDEPFSGVDPIYKKKIKDIFIRLKNNKIGILIIDHNINELLSISNNIYFINNGNIIKYNNSTEFINSSLIKKIYLV